MGIQQDLQRIARQHLGIETLEARNMYSLDCHEVCVQALLAAWLGGIEEMVQAREEEESSRGGQ